MAEEGAFFRDVFADGLAAYTGIEREQALAIVGDAAVFTDLARQTALFITNAHARHVAPPAAGQADRREENFPDGVFPNSHVSFRAFREGSFDASR